MKRKDINEQITDAVRAVTGTTKRKGEMLLGSPELQRQYRAAKAKEAARKKRRK